MKELPFFAIFFRSFLFQAHWSYLRMQGTGFLFTLLPAARLIYPNRQERIEFLKRHSGFFNAQPYCASLALGSVLRQEMELSRSEVKDPAALQKITEVKDHLCGMLGLLGDQLFWQRLKPIAAALGMIGAMLFGGINPAAGLAGILILVLVFNPLHLWMRGWGLHIGFRAGADIVAAINRSPAASLLRRLSGIGFYLAPALVVVASTFARRELGWSALLAFGFGATTTLLLLPRKVSINLILLIVSLMSLLPGLGSLR